MTQETAADAYVRCYTQTPGHASKPRGEGLDAPSEFSLIFDCETKTDPTQSLRFGVFQVREHVELIRDGIFYDPTALTDADLAVLRAYAERHRLDFCTVQDFRFKVFLRVGYETRAQIIGFNLPFDVSRIATNVGVARRSMRGGFSFELSRSYDDPRVRITHDGPAHSRIDFASPAGQDTPRGMRRRKLKVAPHRGYFYDVHTLAAALLSFKGKLSQLTQEVLNTPTKKYDREEHDGPVTEDYIDYARADVQATWECFELLRDRYASYGLSRPLHRIQSEASIGKACLIDMGIQPLLTCQPNLPREAFGPIMASYYGGRAEAHIRRQARQVMLTDFKSMYPTVNTLIGLWEFITADGYTTEASTAATQAFLNSIELADLQEPATWRKLRSIVRIKPNKDILPLRTCYSRIADGEHASSGSSYTLTIGLNLVTSRKASLWYTLADLIASKLLTGKTPVIEQAITFHPGPRQKGLRKLRLLGQAAFLIDPTLHDGFKRLVDMRDAVGKDDPANQPIKTIANSAAYGVSAEVNRDDAPKSEPLMICGPDGSFLTESMAIEQPGKFFHPFLATTITGAARLMLACAERVAADRGLDYVFCDTDSIAMAKPKGLSDDDFYTRAQSVVDWFKPLNPYEKSGSILKIEDVNYELDPQTKKPTGKLSPLFAYAISAKRYCLFSRAEDGTPALRKFSAHGLGHLMDPYPDDDPAPGVPEPIKEVHKLGGKRWQYDFWYHILLAALAGKPNSVRRDYHPALLKPATMRYSASSPALLRWVKPFNEGKTYAAQIKPFNFLTAPMARGEPIVDLCAIVQDDKPRRGAPKKQRKPKPIAPFERDAAVAASRAFDRETEEPVPLGMLKTYADALRGYHVSAEEKFENGGPIDSGLTERRHLMIEGIKLIGKEANGVDAVGMPDPVSVACSEFEALTSRRSLFVAS